MSFGFLKYKIKKVNRYCLKKNNNKKYNKIQSLTNLKISFSNQN